MIRFVRYAALALLLLQAGIYSVSASTGQASEAVVRGLMQQWISAYNNKDIDGLMALYSDDIYYANNGNSLTQSKEAIRSNYAPQFKSAPGVTIDFTEETTVAGPSLGHIAGKYRINIPQADGSVAHAYGRVLLIFRNENDQWKLIVDFDNNGTDISATDFTAK